MFIADPSLWLSLDTRLICTLPSKVRPWLRDVGSLTKHVKRLSDLPFSVRLLGQQQLVTDYHTMMLLGLKRRDTVIVREVQLMSGDTPWVYARSLIPTRALNPGFEELGRMGQRPLGEKLFTDPEMQRGKIELTRLHRVDALYYRALTSVAARPQTICGRRSLFYGAARPIMVSEFFLPDLVQFSPQPVKQ